jgi:hypothetical protein
LKRVVTIPPVPKVVSSRPVVVKRARANLDVTTDVTGSILAAFPTTTSFPSL